MRHREGTRAAQAAFGIRGRETTRPLRWLGPQETGRVSPSLELHRSARLSPSPSLETVNGTGVLFFGWGCFEAMRSIEIKPSGSLQSSPRRMMICNAGWPKGQRASEDGTSDRNRARVSFVVLQKSKAASGIEEAQAPPKAVRACTGA